MADAASHLAFNPDANLLHLNNWVRNGLAGLATSHNLEWSTLLKNIQSPLIISILFSIIGGYVTYKSIISIKNVFVQRGRFGKDLLKTNLPQVPESVGAIVGVIYFVILFLFIPIPFLPFFNSNESDYFPHDRFSQFLGGLLSLFSMLFLGFADDIFDIRWRVKIWFPLIASLPILMVYFVTYGGTDVLIPKIIRQFLLPSSLQYIHLGPLYYGYLAALSVFSTNAINILAGVNGVEAGQSLIISISIIINDFLQLYFNPDRRDAHLLSLFFMIPFIGVTVGFLKHNWYPAKVFPGDTYCYFAGMIFAVVAILGNFSKTLLLFMMPQIFNFLYSCPQLFRFVDCPRHRMPIFDSKTEKLLCSRFYFRAQTLVKNNTILNDKDSHDSIVKSHKRTSSKKKGNFENLKSVTEEGVNIDIFKGIKEIIKKEISKEYENINYSTLLKLIGIRKFMGLIMIKILQCVYLTDIKIHKVNKKQFFVNSKRNIKKVTELTGEEIEKINVSELKSNFEIRDWSLIEYDIESNGEEYILSCNNFTLINLVLIYFKPLKESILCLSILLIQIIFSLIAFFVRYYLARIIYNDTKRFN